MEQWWYAVGGERSGPIGIEALRNLYRDGAIDANTLAWHSGMAEWQRIGDIAELGDLAHFDQAPLLPPALPEPPALTPAVESGAAAAAGPWQRLVARGIDMLLIGIALNIASRIASGHSPMLYLSGFLTGLLVTPAILLVETAFFSATGWTPGKKLLGLTVRTLEGRQPDFMQYGRRLASVWWYGLGAALPIINLIAMFRQYRHLRAGEELVWDAGRFQIEASTPGHLQWALALAGLVVLTLVYLVLMLAS